MVNNARPMGETKPFGVRFGQEVVAGARQFRRGREAGADWEMAMTAFRTVARAAPMALALGLVMAAWPADAQQRRDSLTLYELPDYRGASVTFYGDNANIGSTGFSDRAQSAQVIGTWRLCTGGGYRNRCEVVSGNIRNLDQYGLGRQVGSAQRLGADAPPAPRYEPAPSTRYEPPTAYPLPPAQPRTDSYPPPAQPYAPPYEQPYAPGYSDARPGYGPNDPYYDYTPPAVDVPYGAGAPYAAPGYDAPAAGGVDGETASFFPRPTLNGMDVSAFRPGAADGFCRSQGLGPAVYFDQAQRSPRSVGVDMRPVGPGPILRDVLCRR